MTAKTRKRTVNGPRRFDAHAGGADRFRRADCRRSFIPMPDKRHGSVRPSVGAGWNIRMANYLDPTPTGFHPKALGRRPRRTLGER